jgi:hypothetical protein
MFVFRLRPAGEAPFGQFVHFRLLEDAANARPN